MMLCSQRWHRPLRSRGSAHTCCSGKAAVQDHTCGSGKTPARTARLDLAATERNDSASRSIPVPTYIPSTAQAKSQDQRTQNRDRRGLLLAGVAASLALAANSASADAQSINIVSESEGFGTHPAGDGDILLFHYVGTLEATGQVFDSTRGGLIYRDGGQGVLRPAMVQLGSGPVPGLCRGLRMGLEGMRVGGRRTVVVPAELGFRDLAVGAPYSVVPPGSTLRYDVELLRLSSRGPDELMMGLSRCGTGGASESTQGCADIPPAEFVL